jgi:HlyD family secretion protein
MTKRTQYLTFALLASGVLGLFWAFVPAPTSVEIASVHAGSFVQTVEDDGITQVRDRYVVAAPVSGTLLRPEVHAGDAVGRGQLLASIVPNAAQMLDARTRTELAARVEAAAAREARAGATLRQAEAAELQAQADQARLEQLGKQGFVSAIERERSALSLELRRKDREAALYEQDAAGHDLQQARAALRQVFGAPSAGNAGTWPVRSPVAGQVLRVLQESEGPVGVGAPILEIGDLTRLEARIDVLTSEAIQIAPQAFVQLDAGGGLQLSGRVRLVEPAARTKVSALGVEEQRVNVIVDLAPSAAAAKRIGDAFRVDARIEIAREDKVLLVPVAAVFRDANHWAVYKVAGKRARLTRIELGARGGAEAIVRSGLAAGDQVVVYPSDSVRDGVRIESQKSNAG